MRFSAPPSSALTPPEFFALLMQHFPEMLAYAKPEVINDKLVKTQYGTYCLSSWVSNYGGVMLRLVEEKGVNYDELEELFTKLIPCLDQEACRTYGYRGTPHPPGIWNLDDWEQAEKYGITHVEYYNENTGKTTSMSFDDWKRRVNGLDDEEMDEPDIDDFDDDDDNGHIDANDI